LPKIILTHNKQHQAVVFNFLIRGMSKGMGTFTMEMASYAKVPVRISEEILFKRREENQKV